MEEVFYNPKRCDKKIYKRDIITSNKYTGLSFYVTRIENNRLFGIWLSPHFKDNEEEYLEATFYKTGESRGEFDSFGDK